MLTKFVAEQSQFFNLKKLPPIHPLWGGFVSVKLHFGHKNLYETHQNEKPALF